MGHVTPDPPHRRRLPRTAPGPRPRYTFLLVQPASDEDGALFAPEMHRPASTMTEPLALFVTY